MNKPILNRVNILTDSASLIKRLSEEEEMLKYILSELKSTNQTVNYCVVNEAISRSIIDIFVHIEAIDRVHGETDDHTTKKELKIVQQQLYDFQIEYHRLPQEFHSHLLCPAMENPETNYLMM